MCVHPCVLGLCTHTCWLPPSERTAGDSGRAVPPARSFYSSIHERRPSLTPEPKPRAPSPGPAGLPQLVSLRELRRVWSALHAQVQRLPRGTPFILASPCWLR